MEDEPIRLATQMGGVLRGGIRYLRTWSPRGRSRRRAHGPDCFLTEVSKENAFEMIVEDFTEQAGPLAGVGQVSSLSEDALLESVGVAADLEHVDVVVGLQKNYIRDHNRHSWV